MFLAKLIIYLLISFVLPYFFTFFNYFLCLCWLSTMPLPKFSILSYTSVTSITNPLYIGLCVVRDV